MSTKQKLELNWIGKHKRPRLEPRILLEDKELSYGDADNENLLVHGDNLLALKALEQKYAGKVKCIFIDPPYNTGSAFEHYDDGLEHSMWLSMIRDRLELLRILLSDDGSIWITIDDNECHYLKVICDEIFGRNNFISNSIWQKKYAPSNDAKKLSEDHDHILIYAKNKKEWTPNRLPRNIESNKSYKNPDNDPRGLWRADNYKCNKSASERPNLYYPIIQPNTKEIIWPSETAVWRYNEDTHKRHIAEDLIWWGKDGKNSTPAFKRHLSTVDDTTNPQSVWTWQEVGHNQDAKREVQKLNPKSPFSTPKPEKLLERIIHIASNRGDIVLDSFAGSGTTGAVAHKMGRRWIMVELGEHCQTHIVPRLKKVIDGEDQGGISKSVNWQGGGGFRYFHLAPSLLKKDNWGNWVINKEYNAEMLAEAMCKHMNFTYSPSPTQYWNHGYSTETDYIYVTTGSLAYDQLKVLSEELGSERTLLICCKAFMTEGVDFPNLTLVKIPRAILSKCEWDQDDYSFTLNVLSDSEQPDDIDYVEDSEDEEQL